MAPGQKRQDCRHDNRERNRTPTEDQDEAGLVATVAFLDVADNRREEHEDQHCGDNDAD
ncbi:Uncharacterised protein [Chlamydia trachomatis]|nr:Uncharacterised protein [Chlamydia trachomatis]